MTESEISELPDVAPSIPLSTMQNFQKFKTKIASPGSKKLETTKM